MATRISLHKLIDDFVLNGRRLGDRADIAVSVVNEPRGGVSDGSSNAFQKRGGFQLRYSRPLNQGEAEGLNLLGMLLQHADPRNHDRHLSFVVGTELNRIRRSLGLDLADVAAAARTSEELLYDAENGEKVPRRVLYPWGETLGLFCPARNALVQIIDVSPEILRVLKENPDELRRLQPDQFEAFVANRLERMGFNVKLTGSTTRRDGGIDIIAVPKVMNVGSFVLGAQVKHHRAEQKTGRDAVDRLLAWKGTELGIGMLVTNTSFTRDALWTAAQERNRRFLRLRDFNDLKRWLQDQYGSSDDWREIPDKIELAPGIVIEVPKPRLFSADGNLLDLPESADEN